jgi:hypothetical protein
MCGEKKGWRVEHRHYNKRNLCYCNGPTASRGVYFPHNTTHPLCDNHPNGHYNQAKHAGVKDDELPFDVVPRRPMKADEPCPF